MKEYLTGTNGISEALRRHRGILYVSRTEGRPGTLVELAEECGVEVHKVNENELDRLIPGREHRGVVLEIQSGGRPNQEGSLESLINGAKDNSLIVFLDGITDPRNLGAVLRSADQFAVDAVIIPHRRAAGRDADTLSRASAGAVEWVSIVEVTNIVRTLETLKKEGFWIYGGDTAGTSIADVKLTGRVVLVMGREGKGLGRLVKETCDYLINIPSGGSVDSHNVATAAGILMYEARRQQKFRFN